jgi:hypothetical protein
VFDVFPDVVGGWELGEVQKEFVVVDILVLFVLFGG